MLAWCSCFSTFTSASTLRTCTATGAATACSLLILICDTAQMQLRSRRLSWKLYVVGIGVAKKPLAADPYMQCNATQISGPQLVTLWDCALVLARC